MVTEGGGVASFSLFFFFGGKWQAYRVFFGGNKRLRKEGKKMLWTNGLRVFFPFNFVTGREYSFISVVNTECWMEVELTIKNMTHGILMGPLAPDIQSHALTGKNSSIGHFHPSDPRDVKWMEEFQYQPSISKHGWEDYNVQCGDFLLWESCTYVQDF